MDTRQDVQCIGWMKQAGQRSYLSASGALNARGLFEHEPADAGYNGMQHYALPEPAGEHEQAADVAASLAFLDLADPKVTLPLWLAMYAAPLTPMRSLDAVLWLHGPSGTGKSTLAHLALSHFGAGFISGRSCNPTAHGTATLAYLERAMYMIKDAPLVIDDCVPLNSGGADARAMASKVRHVVRSVGARNGQVRGGIDLVERAGWFPRGVVILTALEAPGPDIAGWVIRLEMTTVRAIPDCSDRLDVAQRAAAGGVYARAMAGYVAWLDRHWDSTRQNLAALIEGESQRAGDLLPGAGAIETYALLAAVDYVALDYARDCGAIGAGQRETLLDGHREVLLACLQGQPARQV
jgi:hypothetical protein